MGEIISVIHLNQKAELYLAQGKLEEAMTVCYQALEIESNFPPTCKILGNILQRMGEIYQAQKWYIKAINKQPNLAESYANLGSIYAQQKQWQLGIECYREAIGIKPNIPGFYRNLGKIWQALGKVELARDCQEQARNLEAQYPKASEYLKQGKNFLENERVEEAITCFQNAIKFNPYLAAAYQNLGDISLKRKDFNEAINYYQKSFELKPNWWLVHHKLGKIFQQIGELDTAIIEFNLAIQLNPNFAWSYKNLGDILNNKKDLDGAKYCYEKVIAIKSDVWDAHRKLNQIIFRQGKLNEVILGCQSVIKINPKLSWPYRIIGDVYQQKKDWDGAILAYRNSLNFANKKDVLYKKLGDVLQEKGLVKEAIANYQKAIAIDPNCYWFYGALGNAYIQEHKFSQAIPYLIQALKLRPDYDDIHQSIRYILNKQGRKDAARIWSLEEKLPPDWLEKFFKLTGDWEVISLLETNIVYLKIYPEIQVNLLASQTIDSQLHPKFQDKKIKLLESFVAIVPEGRGCVELGTTAVISSDNKLVSDISTGCAAVIMSSSQLAPIHYIDENVAFLSAKWGEKNYFHWMFDVVARIDLLRRANVKIDKFVFSSCAKKFQKESLEALGIPLEKVIESRFYPHIKAKQLIVPSFAAKQIGIWINKWGCDFLRNLFLKPQNINQVPHQPQYIYISRKLASWRRVINEEEVVNLLEKFGFVSLTLESMSIAEQVSYMATARVVISPHGAGLTNLVFCSPGTKVIELFSPKYVNSLYWRISNFCNLSYYYLLGNYFDNDNSEKQLWTPDIIVDLKQLLKIMKLAGVI